MRDSKERLLDRLKTSKDISSGLIQKSEVSMMEQLFQNQIAIMTYLADDRGKK